MKSNTYMFKAIVKEISEQSSFPAVFFGCENVETLLVEGHDDQDW